MNAPSLPIPAPPQTEEYRTSLHKDALQRAFLDNLLHIQGKFPTVATPKDFYLALAFAVRDRMLERWISTAEAYTIRGSRTVAYLSAEFLMGPHLGNNLLNLGPSILIFTSNIKRRLFQRTNIVINIDIEHISPCMFN